MIPLMKSIIIVVSVFLSYTACGQSNLEGISKINGTNIYINVKGKGDYLLLLHGGPGLNHSYFIPHLTELEKSFKVIYYDQRACGKSATPSADSISIKFLVDDIEAIRQKFKIQKLNILGHSWGALLAIHYALQHPTEVNKMIMSNPSMLSREYDEEVAQLLKKNFTKEDSTAQAQIMSGGTLDRRKYEELFLLSFKPSAYDKGNITKLNLNLPDNFGAANNTLFAALMKDPALGQNLYDSLSALKFPVLIVHGSSDIIPFRSIERLNQQLPKSEVTIFKQSGHFPFVEETALYNSTVLKFLNVKK